MGRNGIPHIQTVHNDDPIAGNSIFYTQHRDLLNKDGKINNKIIVSTEGLIIHRIVVDKHILSSSCQPVLLSLPCYCILLEKKLQ